MLKELNKRNFKVDLPIRVRSYIKKELGIDVIHTIDNVVRVDVSLINPSEYLKYPIAVYDITGNHTGLKYILRFYTCMGNTPYITPKLIDKEEKPMQANLRYGFLLMIPERDLIPYRNYGRFPIIYDDPITRADWCAASEILILDNVGVSYCEESTNTDPVITLLGDPSYTLDPGEVWVEPGATAMDVEDGDITASIVIHGYIPLVNNYYPAGIYTFTYSVTDSAGASASVLRRVEVLPNQSPTIVLDPDGNGIVSPMVLVQGSNYLEPGYTATDIEDGDITASVTVDIGNLDLNTPGSYTIVYSVTDAFGLSATANRLIQVIADVAPSITLTADASGYISPIAISIYHTTTLEQYQAMIPGATASDVEDGDLTADIVTQLPTTLTTGTYTATYSVADSFGHTVSRDRVINLILIDETPVITLLPDANGNTTPIDISIMDTATVEQYQAMIPGATATDTEDGDLTGSIISTLPSMMVTGTYIAIYTVTDSANHSVTVNRIINLTVIEDQLPVITLLPNSYGNTSPIYIYISSSTTLEQYQAMIPGATATDTEDGDLTASIVSTLPTTLESGTYTATYTVTDSGDNTVSVDRTINVIKANDLPVITLLPDANGNTSEITLTVLNTASVADIIAMIPGATATDTEDGDLTADIVIDQLPVANTEGVVNVRYTVADSIGASSTVFRDVTIVWAPDITIELNYTSPVEIVETSTNEWDTVYKDDYSVTYPDTNWEVVVTGDTVDTSVAGSYTAVYTVTDTTYGASDEVTATFNITAASTGPTITLFGDNPQYYDAVDPSYTYNYVEQGYSATDPQLGDVTSQVVVTDENIVDTPEGREIDKVYTVTTVNGTASAIRKIYIIPVAR